MSLTISVDEARRLLVVYHLTPSDTAGVFQRLGTIQYDPLNPVGRNPDLVLQARVPGYRVDDWQTYAYRDRLIYDAWDKQACLVPTRDWPMRTLIRERYHPWHDRTILEEHPQMAAAALAEIDRRGPLSSLEFDDRTRIADGHSWLGPTRIKRILRSLWCRGILITHHREGVRHYYDRPERVLPLEHVHALPLIGEDAYHRWIILRRHQAAGLLRPRANAEIWSVCGNATTRACAINQLVEMGKLTPILVGSRQTLFHAPSRTLDLLHARALEPRMVFLAPLDNMLWDRKAVEYIFHFKYAWEVYKRAPDRQWGYYVLPVIYGDRFVGRVESRLEGSVWTVQRWWWEDIVQPTVELLDALRAAAASFMHYLGARDIQVLGSVDPQTREAILSARYSDEPAHNARASIGTLNN